MSYQRVSLSASVACIKLAKNPILSPSVSCTGDGGLTTGACLEDSGTGTILTDTLQILDLCGVPPSVALI